MVSLCGVANNCSPFRTKAHIYHSNEQINRLMAKQRKKIKVRVRKQSNKSKKGVKKTSSKKSKTSSGQNWWRANQKTTYMIGLVAIVKVVGLGIAKYGQLFH
jgi:hypothetical protein